MACWWDYSNDDSDSTSDSSDLFWKPGEDFLQNTFHFPVFRDLPHENDAAVNGYWKRNSPGAYVPACNWFFMGEITNDECSQIPFLRNGVSVRDRNGQDDIKIFFYPKSGFFNFQTLKKGSTILVANGQKHNFLDMSIGLRIEQLDSVRVTPCYMNDLLLLSKRYHEIKNAKCWCCGKENTSSTSPASGASSTVASGDGLKKCAACKMALYCSKDCQKKDWKEGHKRSCKAVPIFQRLTHRIKVGHSPFSDYF